MKTFRNFALVASAAIGIGTAMVPQVAFAQTTPTTTTSSTTTTPPATVPAGTTIWSVNAGGAFGGQGAGVFSGTNNGTVDIVKNGGVNLDLRMNGQGCGTTIQCPNGSTGFTFGGRAFENVGVNVTASGGAAGAPVTVENGGVAAVGMTLNLQLLQGTPVVTVAPTPHPAN